MRRVLAPVALLGAAGLAGAACHEKPASAHELRVPLPDGWVATGSNERLFAGPKGATVASFESKREDLPNAEALVAALAGQKLAAVQPLAADDFVGARYQVEGQDAFVGVKRVGARTVWCASLHGATESEVAAVVNVCRDIAVR